MMIHSIFQNVNETLVISIIVEFRFDVINNDSMLAMLSRKPNRDPVLQDQKVLPEDRNRPLLLREFFSHSNFEIPTELPAEIPVELLAYIS